MQLVVNIPDEFYELIKKTDCFISGQRSGKYIINTSFWAIKNGTPLPKGHGRLIDARAFEATMYHQAFETDSDMQKWDSGCWIRYKMFENTICDAPTMLEADKEIENENTT